jgi:nicotinamidase-related amidase
LVEPGSTAVICHEMQRGVVGDLAHPGWQTAEAVAESKMVPNAARLFDCARSAGVRVIHCAAAFRADHAGSFTNAPILQGRMADDDFLIIGTPEVDPIPELWDPDADVVMHRFHGMSAFAGTEMDWILKSLGVRTVIATGVSLNRGITGTVIEAINYGYRVVIPRDCVVGYPRSYGELMLEHTLAALAWVTDSDEVTKCWAS